jgi:hypothetical protein
MLTKAHRATLLEETLSRGFILCLYGCSESTALTYIVRTRSVFESLPAAGDLQWCMQLLLHSMTKHHACGAAL